MGLAAEMVEKIKRKMKERNVTYKEMAKEIGISEPSLKRGFSKNIFTIDRIEQICTVLNYSLEDLGKSNKSNFQVDFLSKEQELFLASEEEAFVIFYLLVSDFSVASIAKHFVFQEKQITRLLLKMDKLNLIKLYPNDKIVTCIGQGVWWRLDGPLSHKYGSLIHSDFMHSKFDGENEHGWLTAGNLSKASLSTLQKNQDKVVTLFKELTELDSSLPVTQKLNVTFVSGVRPWTLPPIRKYRKKK